MSARFARRAGALVALAFALVLFAAPALARTYDGNVVVWTSNDVLSEGDEVAGNVTVVFGSLDCDGPATIDRNVTVYFGSFDDSGYCTVLGTRTNVFGPAAVQAFAPWATPAPETHAIDRSFWIKLGWDLVVVLAFLLFPTRVRVALDRIEHHPGVSALAGVAALVASVPVAAFLAVSIVGIPLIPIEIAALFAALWIGQSAVAILLGRRLYELLSPARTAPPLAALALGLALVTAAEMLPIVGWAATALVALVGLGGTVLGLVRERSFGYWMPPPYRSAPGPMMEPDRTA